MSEGSESTWSTSEYTQNNVKVAMFNLYAWWNSCKSFDNPFGKEHMLL